MKTRTKAAGTPARRARTARTAGATRAAPPAPPPEVVYATNRLVAYRDDGPLARALGHLARGAVPPLLPVAAGAAVTVVLLLAGVGRRADPELFAPVLALLLTGSAAAHPHRGRLDWLVPPVLRATEYVFVGVIGVAQGVPIPLVFTLICVLAYHHYDTVYRTRQRLWPDGWLFRAGLGWEGRMLVVALGAYVGALPWVLAALTGYLGVLFGVESVVSWTRWERRGGVVVDLEEEEEAGS